MALANERSEILANYLAEKKEAGYEILELEASEAAKKINADGYDFTAEEISDFVSLLEQCESKEGELDENSLDNVSGGLWVTSALGAVALGYRIYKKIKNKR